MDYGAIFDWDGVIIDSSAQHERAWELLAAEEGLPLPEGHFKRGFGKRNEVIIPDLGWSRDPAEIRRLGLRKESLYRDLVGTQGVTVLPGARELLTRLREAGWPCAVGSSTHRANIEAIFAATGLGAFFAAVVTGEDVEHGKPAPDVFLLAAARLGQDPRRCVVFEDAFVGIEAAHAGNMACIAVATTHSPTELAARAERVVGTLHEVSLEMLEAVIATGVVPAVEP